ncbi:hypothetical protein [Kineosporia sp. A_224]|uniref:hypothetical protein n=1 Tax=Kineosporia sp. A_224 TaxID=1962180 RepID=UPI000B4ADEBC|nr:hypothetical protein [Kineosporia sp. A_224]
MHQNRPRSRRLRTRLAAAVVAVVALLAVHVSPAAAYSPSEDDGLEAHVTCTDSGVTWTLFVHVEMDGWLYADGTVTNTTSTARKSKLVLGYYSVPYLLATQSGTDQPAVVELGPQTLAAGQTQRILVSGGNSPGVDRWMDQLWTDGVVQPTASSKPRLGWTWHSTTCTAVWYDLHIDWNNREWAVD